MGFFSPLVFIRSFLMKFNSCTKPRGRRRRSSSSSSRRRRRRTTRDPTIDPSLLSFNGELGNSNAITHHMIITNPNSIPCEEEEFHSFTTLYPAYLQTRLVDELREEEFNSRSNEEEEEEEEEVEDLRGSDNNVCLNYSGFGLFTHLQQELDSTSSSFLVSHSDPDTGAQCPTNLRDALTRINPGLAEETVETDIRRRVFRFLNLHESEYSMVFAPRKTSCFELIGESYPFHTDRTSLFTMFDYESSSVRVLEEIAIRKGVSKTLHATFSFPSFTLCSPHTESILSEEKGLFVFPVQSRASGSKYSYQWMSFAQENGWHVLLDASALGPKDMDALGISLFTPDFIVTSFYKSFGSDPTGFCCLFVKNSSIGILSTHCSSSSRGQNKWDNNIVRLVAPPTNIMNDDDMDAIMEKENLVHHSIQMRPAEVVATFSGRISQTQENEYPSEDECTIRVTHLSQFQDGQLISQDRLNEGKVPLENSGNLTKDINATELVHNLYKDSVEGIANQLYDLQSTHLSTFEHGETSSKESVLTDMESSRHELDLMPIHNPRKRVHERTTFMASRSHEYRNDSDNYGRLLNNATLGGLEAFSQPLFKRNASFTHNRSEGSSSNYDDELDFSSSLYDEDELYNEEEQSHVFDDVSEVCRNEPKIYCRGLNHADALGLNKINDRMMFLINWLVNSMLKLQHLVSSKSYKPLVQIYGPEVKYDRGPSIAFNLFDQCETLIAPELVQKLAKTHNISIGTRVLTHIDEASWLEVEGHLERKLSISESMYNKTSPKLRVVTSTVGLFTTFADVYKLWTFVAKFLNPEFCKQCMCETEDIDIK